jgi:hypothetical protein
MISGKRFMGELGTRCVLHIGSCLTAAILSGKSNCCHSAIYISVYVFVATIVMLSPYYRRFKPPLTLFISPGCQVALCGGSIPVYWQLTQQESSDYWILYMTAMCYYVWTMTGIELIICVSELLLRRRRVSDLSQLMEPRTPNSKHEEVHLRVLEEPEPISLG